MIKYVDLGKIKTKIFLPEKGILNDNIFIICHGFCSSKESDSVGVIAEKLNENNIPAISFDFPGHGESPETTNELTVENCIEYINTVIEYIKKEFNNKKISIFAVSFGAYVTLNKLIKENKNDFKNIILRSPAIDMKNILIDCLIKEDFSMYEKNKKAKAGFAGKIEVPFSFYEDLCQNDILKTYHREEKIIIFQGIEDDTSPIKDTYEFIQKNPCNIELIAMPGVKHKMSKEEIEQIAEKMIEYIEVA